MLLNSGYSPIIESEYNEISTFIGYDSNNEYLIILLKSLETNNQFIKNYSN